MKLNNIVRSLLVIAILSIPTFASAQMSVSYGQLNSNVFRMSMDLRRVYDEPRLGPIIATESNNIIAVIDQIERLRTNDIQAQEAQDSLRLYRQELTNGVRRKHWDALQVMIRLVKPASEKFRAHYKRPFGGRQKPRSFE